MSRTAGASTPIGHCTDRARRKLLHSRSGHDGIASVARTPALCCAPPLPRHCRGRSHAAALALTASYRFVRARVRLPPRPLRQPLPPLPPPPACLRLCLRLCLSQHALRGATQFGVAVQGESPPQALL